MSNETQTILMVLFFLMIYWKLDTVINLLKDKQGPADESKNDKKES